MRSFGDSLIPEKNQAVWVTEELTSIPKNIYGIIKTAAEDLCWLFHRNYKLPCLVLRTSRFFPEESDKKEVCHSYQDANIKVNEKMEKEISEDKLREIASQLGCPNGQTGVEMGNTMNETNINMTLQTVESLNLTDNDILLELGHGNCGHLKEVLKQADHLTYFGLEISETMKKEAENNNLELINQNKAKFSLYDGRKTHFKNDFFHKIMTINTIYFWEKPIDLLNEIYRITKTGGKCSIAYAQKEFMKSVPFTSYNFRLYNNKKLEKLINKTPFKLLDFIDKTERVKSKTGEIVDRDYSIVRIEK